MTAARAQLYQAALFGSDQELADMRAGDAEPIADLGVRHCGVQVISLRHRGKNLLY